MYVISMYMFHCLVLDSKLGGIRTHTTFTITITITKWRIGSSILWITPNQLWQHCGCCALTLIWNNPPIMPVYANIIFLGVEVGGPSNNITSTLTISTTMILPNKIWWIIGPVFEWITHVWVFPTLGWQKLPPSIQQSTFC